MSEQRTAKREAIEARALVDLEAIQESLNQHIGAITKIASHFTTSDQHPQGPHIFTYIYAARNDLEQARQMLNHAAMWFRPDEDEPDD